MDSSLSRVPPECPSPLPEIHYNDANKLQEALPLFQSAIKIDPDPVEPPSLIKKLLV